jgi:hypothetical protein
MLLPLQGIDGSDIDGIETDEQPAAPSNGNRRAILNDDFIQLL